MLFLRKRDRQHPFWRDYAADPKRDVPAALRELVRDDQVVIGPIDAALAVEYLEGLGFSDDDPGDGSTRTPVELVDGDGRPVAL